jgi:hypothetical protein
MCVEQYQIIQYVRRTVRDIKYDIAQYEIIQYVRRTIRDHTVCASNSTRSYSMYVEQYEI